MKQSPHSTSRSRTFCSAIRSPGIYDLYYANQYPDEVSAVIGIDASLPGQINGLAGQGNPANRLVATSGLLRAVTTVMPSLIEPDGTRYTAQEREQMRAMTIWNWANPALLDEANQGARNFSVVEDMTYPADIPVLSFIKKEGSQAGWRTLHQAQLEDRAPRRTGRTRRRPLSALDSRARARAAHPTSSSTPQE